jgi:hypothetical protein
MYVELRKFATWGRAIMDTKVFSFFCMMHGGWLQKIMKSTAISD